MAVVLEGGCRVSTMGEGSPQVDGSLKVWNHIGKASGADAISLRILEFDSGTSTVLRNSDCDEVLYLLEGSCSVVIDGVPYQLGPDTGVYLRPGQTLRVENHDVVTFVSSQCPAETLTARNQSPTIARLSDQRAMPTGDRWYRVLIDAQVTQFVGSIPPGRAPDHFHEYEEVLFILRGEGRMWAGESNTPIGPGSCVYLPRRQVHCVENKGEGELRLLGVFYPAGSPAVRYEAADKRR
jgi:mannose-6-phosphate isomerase-like protein (cupin superfamily)